MKKAHFTFISAFNHPSGKERGNVSAIVWLENPLNEDQYQPIASDLNQPATTFLWKEKDAIGVRWFAPDAEIGLCGHGSMAALYYLHKYRNLQKDIRLASKAGGSITGRVNPDSTYSLQLDAIPVEQRREAPQGLAKALGKDIEAYYPTANKHIVVLRSEEEVTTMQPDFSALRAIDVFGYAVTASGQHHDFVSRTLVPHVQQLEDHATGSSHAALFPFWAERLGKTHLTAIQASPRGGYFEGRVEKVSVTLRGHCRLIAEGELLL
jgi:PhzF family phenazine biosynthesis protein